MEKVINLGIPHVGENIFENIDTPGLMECALVSKTWETLAYNVLLKRWKGKLIQACESGYVVVVRLLLENLESTELNARDSNGKTAFMTACINGHKKVVNLILDHALYRNIHLNARCRSGLTAFMEACKSGRTEVVKLSMEHSNRNMDLNAQDEKG